MNEYFTLVLGIVNAAYIIVNIINQKWDVLVLNVIVCVLCIANFIANEKEKFYKIREYLDTFTAKENKEGIQENILGTSAFNMNKATKELNSDLDFVRTCDELGMTKKEREEAVRQFHANGITSKEDIKNAMDIRMQEKEKGEKRRKFEATRCFFGLSTRKIL